MKVLWLPLNALSYIYGIINSSQNVNGERFLEIVDFSNLFCELCCCKAWYVLTLSYSKYVSQIFESLRWRLLCRRVVFRSLFIGFFGPEILKECPDAVRRTVIFVGLRLK